MIVDRIIAVVACAATVVCMIIALLSYLKDKNEKKIKPPTKVSHMDGLLQKMWRRPIVWALPCF